MIKEKFGDRLDGWICAALPFLFKRRLDPNSLTVAGAFISLVAALAFACGWFVTGGVLVLSGGFFDLIDGVVARHRGVASRFGAFLDSTLDRLTDMSLLFGIAMHYTLADQPGVVALAGAALIATVLVSYSKACAERFVPEVKVGFFERAERLLVLAVGAISGFLIPALWIVAVGGTITVIQRFAFARREMEQIDADERTALGEKA